MEVRSEIEAEILKNMAEEGHVTWQQLEEEGKMMEDVHRSDLRTFELIVAEDILHTERHQRDYENLSIETPVGGLVVLESMYKGNSQFGQTSTGDQVYPGALFMRVVDISKMVLNASVNQVDAQSVRIGQKTTVVLDAYPEMELSGRVVSVGAMATAGGGSRFGRGGGSQHMKNINVLIAIDQKDERVLPDLSGSADVLISTADADVIVPREALRGVDGRTVVYVREGDGFAEREVVVDAMEILLMVTEPGTRRRRAPCDLEGVRRRHRRPQRGSGGEPRGHGQRRDVRGSPLLGRYPRRLTRRRPCHAV